MALGIQRLFVEDQVARVRAKFVGRKTAFCWV
jgi:hypothetical protein